VKSEHYFTENPTSPLKLRTIQLLYKGRILKFLTGGGVFATENIDPGTALLVENLVLKGNERVLDMGCGWGAIGVAAAISVPKGSVVMTDINKRALDLARKNTRTAGLTNVEVVPGNLFARLEGERFDVIASNPPYRGGRELILRFIDEASAHLETGGRLVIVGKGTQGIIFYQHYLKERWKSVEVLGRKSGYRVIEAREPLT
jgi:16S rRNA G1207 methylase RsmC